MRGVRFGASRSDFVRLFEGDSVAGLGEGELLARFVTRRDEAAFEALVTRLGPMVLGVARRMLSDPHDVDDAFQATFLVLVKKAGSIRDRDLVAAWLHGVASKVARRARAESIRRKARERLAMVPEAVEDRVGVESGWLELRALIDEEIERLPEAHRRAVVLCDIEGLSREEAALRLGWSLNMVRGRLERARGRLRGRLARRGVAPSGAWMALMVSPPVPSPSLLSTTIRASLAFSGGRMATGLGSASAVALSQGVLRMMMLSKLKVGLVLLVSAGFVAGGSGMLAAQGPGDKPGAEPAKVVAPAQSEPFLPRSSAELVKARIDLALQRYKTQLSFYDQGRITIDRLMDASRALMDAERDIAGSKGARVDAVRAHYNRVKEILKKEEAELEVGRATESDVNEIKTGLLDAEFVLAKQLEEPEVKPAADAKAGSSPPALTRTSLNQERIEIARRIYDQARKLHVNDRVESSVALEAALTLANAEEGAARTKADRIAAARAQVDRLKEIVAVNEARVQADRGTTLDVDQARLRLLDAESLLLDVFSTPEEAVGTVAPASGGAIPRSVPGVLKGSVSPANSPLARAIASFNAEAAKDEWGRDQPPLTEDEVIAAIRIYQPPLGGIPSSEVLLPRLRQIARTGELPPDATIRFATSRDPAADSGEDCVIDGWWVWIEMRAAGGNTVAFPIRSQVFRTVTLEAARDRAYAMFLKFGQNSDQESRRKAHQLMVISEALETKIERSKAQRGEKAASEAARR